jgi:hypothetical protein
MERMGLLCGIAAACTAVACGAPHLTCGSGTKAVDNECVSLNQLPDPLLGAWLRTNGDPSRSCEFFGDGQWDNTCFITSGWPIKWSRLYEDRYVIGSTITSCDVTTAFSTDAKSATLTMFCGRIDPETVVLTRLR